MKSSSASSDPNELAPLQIKAARALLAWSQQDLAKAAGVAQSTVADFERGVRQPVPNNVAAMRNALEMAGVNFLKGGAVIGPPVPPLKGAPGAGAARFINAADLEHWAARRDAQSTLPHLIHKLVVATIGSSPIIDFPSDEAIQLAGWDGRTYSEKASAFVPVGNAGWEIGVQRNGILKKAQDDYQKRTEDPEPLNPADSTFVFVTPRTWPQKERWAKERRAEGIWRDVRAYDATDLVRWIEQYPSVGLWLAVQIGKRPDGARMLEEGWSEWSLATRWPLSENLVLADRDKEATEVLRWLRGQPSTLALKSETAEEVAAFVVAAIRTLPGDLPDHYLSRAVLATSAETARALGDGSDPLIIVLLDPDAGLARRMEGAGHFVLLAYGDGEHGQADLTTLPRPTRDGMIPALIEMGIEQAQAEALAREAARSIGILRRLIPAAPGRLPGWAKEPPPRALRAALLAGGWSEGNEADKKALERLSGLSYTQFSQSLSNYISALDSPLRKVGDTWKVASGRDAWFLLARYLVPADIEQFGSVAIDVLGAVDPRFDVEPDERWMAALDGSVPMYSGWLRRGVGETLILLAQFGARVTAEPDAAQRAQYIVRKLLRGASAKQLWSLADDFRLLSEAAPEAFLDMIDESLSLNDPPVGALFGGGEDPFFTTEKITELLWALEALAWSPRYMSRVAGLLARLDEIDPGGRSGNRPGDSLRDLFLPWSPQTFATYKDRLKVLDRLRRQHPDTAWRLLLNILPKGHDSVSPTPQPRWLDFSEWQKEAVTWQSIRSAAIDTTNRLIEDAGGAMSRWEELVERLPDLAPDCNAAIQRLQELAGNLTRTEDKEALRTRLRALVTRHRSYPDAGWAMENEALERLEAIYEELAPSDPIDRFAWLFRNDARIALSRRAGWREAQEDLLEARRLAALEVYESGGIEAIFTLALKDTSPGYIGAAFRQTGFPEQVQESILEAALKDVDPRIQDVGYGLISVKVREKGQPWATSLLERASNERWGDQAILTILKAFPQQRWVWDLAASMGEVIESKYWKDIPVLWIEGPAAEIEFAARRLIGVGRAHQALHLVGDHLRAGLPTQLLIETLQQAVKDVGRSDNQHENDAVMFQHFVVEILKVLDARADADEDSVMSIEWVYLRALEYSERKPIVLLRALATRPDFFIEIIKMVYKPTEDSGVAEERVADPDTAQRMGEQAWTLLRLWDRVPGSDDAGMVDHSALVAWVRRARSLAAECGREGIVDQKIGEVLSASADDPDGAWPQRAIRDLIDSIRNAEIESGFSLGLYNRRGVTTRGLRDGGLIERKEAARYRAYASAIALEWPRTAALLERIAADYEQEARMHDRQAERLDWES
ncbi:helix-turn-helix domain-containing protein [Hyphomonas sp. NPDC076900]|uniref:helix-turn-helix domain-containing protein n=1 Tax=unclassified Hyphomonas TaxID=2630699 RepID=UPI003CFF8805